MPGVAGIAIRDGAHDTRDRGDDDRPDTRDTRPSTEVGTDSVEAAPITLGIFSAGTAPPSSGRTSRCAPRDTIP